VLELFAERRDEHPKTKPKMARARIAVTAGAKMARALTRRGIGEFPEDGRMARAGGAWKIVWVAAPGFAGEHGEGEGFFCVAGNAEFIGGNDFQRRQQGGEIGDEQWIARAAAGDDEFVHARAWEDEIPESASDGDGRECRDRVNQIVGAHAAAFRCRDETRDIRRAEFLAAGGFRRGFAEERMREEIVQQFRHETASAGELRVAVVAEATASEMRGEGIDDHVAGAGVESEDIFPGRGRGNHGDVGDAADIESDTAAARMTVEKIIDERHERRSLTSRGHIGGTKIGNRCDASALGDDGRLGELESGRDAGAEELAWRALMIERLAVRADQGDAARRNAKFAAGAQRGGGE